MNMARNCVQNVIGDLASIKYF